MVNTNPFQKKTPIVSKAMVAIVRDLAKGYNFSTKQMTQFNAQLSRSSGRSADFVRNLTKLMQTANSNNKSFKSFNDRLAQSIANINKTTKTPFSEFFDKANKSVLKLTSSLEKTISIGKQSSIVIKAFGGAIPGYTPPPKFIGSKTSPHPTKPTLKPFYRDPSGALKFIPSSQGPSVMDKLRGIGGKISGLKQTSPAAFNIAAFGRAMKEGGWKGKSGLERAGALTGKGVKELKVLGKKGVQKTFELMGKMGKVMKTGVATAAGSLLNTFRAMQPFRAVGDAVTKSFGGLVDIMSAQFAPVIGKLVSGILTPSNIKMFENLGKSLLPIVDGFAQMITAVLNGKAFRSFMQGIQDLFNELATSGVLDALIDSLLILANSFFGFLEEILPVILPPLIQIATTVFGLLAQILPSLSPLFMLFAEFMQIISDILSDPAVQSAFRSIIDNLVLLVTNVFEILKPLLPIVIPFLIQFADAISEVACWISGVILSLVNTLDKLKGQMKNYDEFIKYMNIFVDLLVFMGIGGGSSLSTSPQEESPQKEIVYADSSDYTDIQHLIATGQFKPPSVNVQGRVSESGLAVVHAGENVVKDHLVREVVREAITVNNTFNGQVGPNERREFTRSMKKIWDD